MRQKLIMIVLLLAAAVILIGLNAASYSPQPRAEDSEFMPNRSTYNSGATGMLAFYSLLTETGRSPVRWQQPPAALLTTRNEKPSVFVVTGELKRNFTGSEPDDLLRWVAAGGRLVLIDRRPPPDLLKTTASWRISLTGGETAEIMTVAADDRGQMIAGASAIKSVQPTVYSESVNAVQPSRFAATINIERDPDAGGAMSGETVESPSQIAPMVTFADTDTNLVVDMPFGDGSIVLVSDPYMVSNAGIEAADNLQLALNLVSSAGIVAFDEYHQGYGSDSNRFLQFFAGTPVIALFLQAALLVGLVLVSRSRRFARPIPEQGQDRLSKLEYVAAMAEIQSRSEALDLAVENIYSEFHRRAVRTLGLKASASGADIASAAAERTGAKREPIADLLFQCEEIIRGEPTSRRQVLRLIRELREIEQRLGMSRTERERV